MIEVSLKSKSGAGSEVKILLPASISELTISQYFDIMAQVWAIQSDENPVLCMANAISAACGIDILQIMNAVTGRPPADPGHLVPGQAATLAQLFGYLAKACTEYSPKIREDNNFVHNGIAYEIPAYRVMGIGNQKMLEELTTWQSIEALEVQRLAALNIKETGDADGAFGFTQYVTQVAIMATPSGAPFPESKAEIDAQIDFRKKEFQSLSADIALDVDFFLFNMLTAYGCGPKTSGFLIVCQSVFIQMTQRMRPRSRPYLKQEKKTPPRGLDSERLIFH